MKEYENQVRARGGIFSRIRAALSDEVKKRRDKPSVLIADVGALLVGFLFARCHVIFGARPLAIGALALLPSRVFTLLIGTVAGALSLGGGGSVYAVIYTLLVALRIIVSSGRDSDGELFCEGLPMRMSEATIAGFLAAAYQLLLVGISIEGVLFGVSMVLIPPLATFLLSGIFDTDIALGEFFCGKADLFTLKESAEKEKYTVVFFQCSLLLFSLLTSLSLAEFDVLGFSLAYVYVAAATLFCARRFGAVRAAAVGFVSAIPISSVWSVAFSLGGLAAGALFGFGVAWGIGAGAIALSAWSAYTGGAMGILATLPEYAVGAAIIAPFVKNNLQKKTDIEPESPSNEAGEMVGTMALAYQNRPSHSLDALEMALVGISTAARSFDHGEPMREEDYRLLVESVADGYDAFGADRVKRLFCEKSAIIAHRLKHDEGLSAAMLGVSENEMLYAEELVSIITQKATKLKDERYRQTLTADGYEDYRLISKLINEARAREERARGLDAELSASLSDMFVDCGFSGGIIKAFGDRKKHVIAAGEDPDGSLITSPEIKLGIERLTNTELGEAEYFRRGKTVLMEAESAPKYRVEYASAAIAGSTSEVSGDLSDGFWATDDYFYALLSDGMGSGDLARETAGFVVGFLKSALEAGGFCDTLLHIINHIIRRKGEECSATVDVFELDLISGDALFIKSGAAPSYVKRESSIFRIKSETAPIGLMKSIDAERVRVEVKAGDYVIMLSDGVSSTPEDAPWLLELLAEPPKRNVKEYAEYILSAAVKNSRTGDDMTVSVAKIIKRE